MSRRPANPIFIGGTSSNAGKSWMATALCAWLHAQGVRVAPFKAQNMSNNSYPCTGGGEIGRAQVAQAEACGLEPEAAMNPILLKPSGGSSQVIVNGRVWKTLSPRGYYGHIDELRALVIEAYRDLARRFDVIVIEGAGSVTELNLRTVDLVNLWLVTELRAPWFLVADIERGGVFASVLGTVGLLTSDERALFRGFAINKFHGDMTLFDDGVRELESRTGASCLGVFPYAPDIHLDGEDSLALDVRGEAGSAAPAGARIAIVRFPHISNATDFRLLTWADWITARPDRDYDFVVLPGSKNTMRDLQWLRRQGLDAWLLEQRRRGARVIGVCGGFQMLGRSIRDPHGVESDEGAVAGLALLPVDTTLTREKTTRVVRATTPGGASFQAYTIHMGETSSAPAPFVTLADGAPDGARADGVMGTYLHGAFEDAAVCSEIFGVPIGQSPSKADEYRRLGEWFGRHVRSEPLMKELFTMKAMKDMKGAEGTPECSPQPPS